MILLRSGLCLMSLVLSVSMLSSAPAHAEPVFHQDKTGAVEAARVDRVPTPQLDWRPCPDGNGSCTSVRLPLDYDNPRGAKITVSLRKVPARDASRRIGTLFVNPGGPGSSGKEFASRISTFSGAEVLGRFDIVGMDPRGTNDSTRTNCFPSSKVQKRVLQRLEMAFPVTAEEERSFTRAASELAAWCSTFGYRMASASSTAQVARDLDILRRAVGDEKLTYLGFSYGTYLGQVYANMFPDRVRAIAIDGVINPIDWIGEGGRSRLPMTMRFEAAESSWRALRTLLQRCARSSSCPLSDPMSDFERVVQRLKRQPIVVPGDDQEKTTITYQAFIVSVVLSLYSPVGVSSIPEMVSLVDQMESANRPAARIALAKRYRHLESAAQTVKDLTVRQRYVNVAELPAVVMCSDSRNPWNPWAWRTFSAVEDERFPYVGRYWLWGSSYCSVAWQARDEDAYRGPFDRVTSAPILVIGNEYDPATSVKKAREVASLIPRSRLVISNNWGHTAYGVSQCATRAIDEYLITPETAGTGAAINCTDGAQPFGR